MTAEATAGAVSARSTGQATVLVRSYTAGVAVVMPAYGEEENLASTVEDFLNTLDSAGHAHQVVVVNDGSPDATGKVLDELAERYPGRVVAVHHKVNQGYGAAVRTGIQAALERTDMRHVLLTDSDGQFKAEDLLTFLAVQREERADAVIGYRKSRADPLPRKVNAFLWTWTSRLLLHTPSRDVDCAYKLIDRRLLDGVELTGEAAAISPEVLAKVSTNRARIIEHPVNHYPRLHGHQTGARLSVILRSLLSLARVHRDLVRSEHRWPRVSRLLHPRDPVLAILTAVTTLASVAAYLYYRSTGAVLAYPDAVSHVMIARRVVDSPTAGVAQLGGVWLPLPHLLSLPFVWSRELYESGLAGSIVSMLAFVATVRYLYRIAVGMAGSRLAGLAAAGLFVVNVNALYLQSTPMTETLLLACIAGAVHHLQEWCRTGRYGQLAACSVLILLGTLTRYEGWVLCLAAIPVVAYAALRRWRGYTHIESHLIFFGIVAFSGIAGWLAWNALIFGDPFYWQSGAFSKPSLWVSEQDTTVGDLGASIRTYAIAVDLVIGVVALLLALVGLGAYVYRTRLRVATTAPYTLLVFMPFFVYAVFSGQRPLHVPQMQGDLYNVRFGLVMLLPVAVFAGYLVSLVPRHLGGAAKQSTRRPVRMLSALTRAPRAAMAVGVITAALALPETATLTEAHTFRASVTEKGNAAAAAWLREHYDGGLVLMQSFGNESVTFDSRLPTRTILYEGSFRKWEAALADPAQRGVRWIYMRSTPGNQDQVWRELHTELRLVNNYTLLYQDSDRLIYRRGEASK